MSKFPPELDKHPLSGGLTLVSQLTSPNINPSTASTTIRRITQTKPIPPYHLEIKIAHKG